MLPSDSGGSGDDTVATGKQQHSQAATSVQLLAAHDSGSCRWRHSQRQSTAVEGASRIAQAPCRVGVALALGSGGHVRTR